MKREKLSPALTMACLATGLYGVALFGLEAGSELQRTLADLGMVGAGLAAGGCALVAAHRQRLARARWSWLLMGLGLLGYALGDAYWAWAELIDGQAPTVPSWADLGYLAMVPLALVGILLRPVLRPRDISRRLLLLDAVIVISCLTAFSWTLVLRPLFADLDTDPMVQAITLAYPLGDIALGFCLAMLILRSARNQPSHVLLLLGWASMALADSAYLALTARGTYSSGDPTDLAWFAGLMLLAAGAWADPVVPMMPAAVAPDLGHPWRFVAPAALLAGAGVVAWLVPLLADGRGPEVDQLAVALGALALLLRYVSGYRDTALAHRFEHARREEAQAVALRDPLTGAANRRAFDAALDELIERARTDGEPFGLALIDVDHFKQFNDTYGHAAGDDALRETVGFIRSQVRASDVVARIGGDEFAVLVPRVDAGPFASLMAQLGQTLRGHARVSGSVGGATWLPSMNSARDLVEAADCQLYEAKRHRQPTPAVGVDVGGSRQRNAVA
jgi:diguanylate cyclase (GGDEF)-like protein